MDRDEIDLNKVFELLFQAHPWHGVSPGEKAPAILNAYIELVPTDAVKYELDKTSGHLRVDRPQRFSSMCPALYGFIPQTFCGDKVGAFCARKTGRTPIHGDQDPMDICVLTEKLCPWKFFSSGKADWWCTNDRWPASRRQNYCRP